MKSIHVGAAVLNQTPLDWEGNRRHIEEALSEAQKAKVQFLCLPELCVTGYGCEDMFHSAGLLERAEKMAMDVAPLTQGMVVSLGLPLLVKNAVYNTALVLVDGRPIGFAAKRHLAGDGIHYEPRWFAAWPAGVIDDVAFAGRELPVGDQIFDIGGVRLGFEICEDGWVAQRPGADHAEAGADLIFNPSASHFAFGKQNMRRRLVLEGSRAFCVTYVYTNLLGNEAGRIIYDGGVMIASGGNMVAEGPRFGFGDMELTTALIDLDATRMQQARTVSTRPRLGDEDRLLEVHFKLNKPTVKQKPSPEPAEMSKEEEFGRAVSLGLFDYLRKSRSRGFVLSLSGGADSSTVACLIRLMLDLARADLGWNGLKKKLGYIEKLREKTLARDLLVCVYQRTKNSSEDTFLSAKELAEYLEAEFICWDIDELVEQYESIIETAIDRKLTWEDDDIARQNIQARVRAPGVWMLANLRHALLLSTSNRSEAAVGYATMDGDTSGGLCPVAGIDKAFLLHWLAWHERTDGFGLGDGCEGLKRVNRLQPSAELRPLESGQTDEDDLMPYAVLEAIEEAAIRDKKSPADVFETLSGGDIEAAQLKFWITRFFRLWSRNQWKRERYAPSFHLDDENLDPKTWCRFPILSGGFSEELKELNRED